MAYATPESKAGYYASNPAFDENNQPLLIKKLQPNIGKFNYDRLTIEPLEVPNYRYKDQITFDIGNDVDSTRFKYNYWKGVFGLEAPLPEKRLEFRYNKPEDFKPDRVMIGWRQGSLVLNNDNIFRVYSWDQNGHPKDVETIPVAKRMPEGNWKPYSYQPSNWVNKLLPAVGPVNILSEVVGAGLVGSLLMNEDTFTKQARAKTAKQLADNSIKRNIETADITARNRYMAPMVRGAEQLVSSVFGNKSIIEGDPEAYRRNPMGETGGTTGQVIGGLVGDIGSVLTTTFIGGSIPGISAIKSPMLRLGVAGAVGTIPSVVENVGKTTTGEMSGSQLAKQTMMDVASNGLSMGMTRGLIEKVAKSVASKQMLKAGLYGAADIANELVVGYSIPSYYQVKWANERNKARQDYFISGTPGIDMYDALLSDGLPGMLTSVAFAMMDVAPQFKVRSTPNAPVHAVVNSTDEVPPTTAPSSAPSPAPGAEAKPPSAKPTEPVVPGQENQPVIIPPEITNDDRRATEIATRIINKIVNTTAQQQATAQMDMLSNLQNWGNATRKDAYAWLSKLGVPQNLMEKVTQRLGISTNEDISRFIFHSMKHDNYDDAFDAFIKGIPEINPNEALRQKATLENAYKNIRFITTGLDAHGNNLDNVMVRITDTGRPVIKLIKNNGDVIYMDGTGRITVRGPEAVNSVEQRIATKPIKQMDDADWTTIVNASKRDVQKTGEVPKEAKKSIPAIIPATEAPPSVLEPTTGQIPEAPPITPEVPLETTVPPQATGEPLPGAIPADVVTPIIPTAPAEVAPPVTAVPKQPVEVPTTPNAPVATEVRPETVPPETTPSEQAATTPDEETYRKVAPIVSADPIPAADPDVAPIGYIVSFDDLQNGETHQILQYNNDTKSRGFFDEVPVQQRLPGTEPQEGHYYLADEGDNAATKETQSLGTSPEEAIKNLQKLIAERRLAQAPDIEATDVKPFLHPTSTKEIRSANGDIYLDIYDQQTGKFKDNIKELLPNAEVHPDGRYVQWNSARLAFQDLGMLNPFTEKLLAYATKFLDMPIKINSKVGDDARPRGTTSYYHEQYDMSKKLVRHYIEIRYSDAHPTSLLHEVLHSITTQMPKTHREAFKKQLKRIANVIEEWHGDMDIDEYDAILQEYDIDRSRIKYMMQHPDELMSIPFTESAVARLLFDIKINDLGTNVPTNLWTKLKDIILGFVGRAVDPTDKNLYNYLSRVTDNFVDPSRKINYPPNPLLNVEIAPEIKYESFDRGGKLNQQQASTKQGVPNASEITSPEQVGKQPGGQESPRQEDIGRMEQPDQGQEVAGKGQAQEGQIVETPTVAKAVGEPAPKVPANVADVDAKRADIERRRQEELNRKQKFTYNRVDPNFEQAPVIPFNEINIEKSNINISPTAVTKVRVLEYKGINRNGERYGTVLINWSEPQDGFSEPRIHSQQFDVIFNNNNIDAKYNAELKALERQVTNTPRIQFDANDDGFIDGSQLTLYHTAPVDNLTVIKTGRGESLGSSMGEGIYAFANRDAAEQFLNDLVTWGDEGSDVIPVIANGENRAMYQLDTTGKNLLDLESNAEVPKLHQIAKEIVTDYNLKLDEGDTEVLNTWTSLQPLDFYNFLSTWFKDNNLSNDVLRHSLLEHGIHGIVTETNSMLVPEYVLFDNEINATKIKSYQESKSPATKAPINVEQPTLAPGEYPYTKNLQDIEFVSNDAKLSTMKPSELFDVLRKMFGNVIKGADQKTQAKQIYNILSDANYKAIELLPDPNKPGEYIGKLIVDESTLVPTPTGKTKKRITTEVVETATPKQMQPEPTEVPIAAAETTQPKKTGAITKAEDVQPGDIVSIYDPADPGKVLKTVVVDEVKKDGITYKQSISLLGNPENLPKRMTAKFNTSTLTHFNKTDIPAGEWVDGTINPNELNKTQANIGDYIMLPDVNGDFIIPGKIINRVPDASDVSSKKDLYNVRLLNNGRTSQVHLSPKKPGESAFRVLSQNKPLGEATMPSIPETMPATETPVVAPKKAPTPKAPVVADFQPVTTDEGTFTPAPDIKRALKKNDTIIYKDKKGSVLAKVILVDPEFQEATIRTSDGKTLYINLKPGTSWVHIEPIKRSQQLKPEVPVNKNNDYAPTIRELQTSNAYVAHPYTDPLRIGDADSKGNRINDDIVTEKQGLHEDENQYSKSEAKELIDSGLDKIEMLTKARLLDEVASRISSMSFAQQNDAIVKATAVLNNMTKKYWQPLWTNFYTKTGPVYDRVKSLLTAIDEDKFKVRHQADVKLTEFFKEVDKITKKAPKFSKAQKHTIGAIVKTMDKFFSDNIITMYKSKAITTKGIMSSMVEFDDYEEMLGLYRQTVAELKIAIKEKDNKAIKKLREEKKQWGEIIKSFAKKAETTRKEAKASYTKEMEERLSDESIKGELRKVLQTVGIKPSEDVLNQYLGAYRKFADIQLELTKQEAYNYLRVAKFKNPEEALAKFDEYEADFKEAKAMLKEAKKGGNQELIDKLTDQVDMQRNNLAFLKVAKRRIELSPLLQHVAGRWGPAKKDMNYGIAITEVKVGKRLNRVPPDLTHLDEVKFFKTLKQKEKYIQQLIGKKNKYSFEIVPGEEHRAIYRGIIPTGQKDAGDIFTVKFNRDINLNQNMEILHRGSERIKQTLFNVLQARRFNDDVKTQLLQDIDKYTDDLTNEMYLGNDSDYMNNLTHDQYVAQMGKYRELRNEISSMQGNEISTMLRSLINGALVQNPQFLMNTHNTQGYQPDNLAEWANLGYDGIMNGVDKQMLRYRNMEAQRIFENEMLDMANLGLAVQDNWIYNDFKKMHEAFDNRHIYDNVTNKSPVLKDIAKGLSAADRTLSLMWFGLDALRVGKNILAANQTVLKQMMTKSWADVAQKRNVSDVVKEFGLLGKSSLKEFVRQFRQTTKETGVYKNDPFLQAVHNKLTASTTLSSGSIAQLESQVANFANKKLANALMKTYQASEYMMRYTTAMTEATLNKDMYLKFVEAKQMTMDEAIHKAYIDGLTASKTYQGEFDMPYRSGVERWALTNLPFGKTFLTMKGPAINQLIVLTDDAMKGIRNRDTKTFTRFLITVFGYGVLVGGLDNIFGFSDAAWLWDQFSDKDMRTDMKEGWNKFMVNSMGADPTISSYLWEMLDRGATSKLTGMNLGMKNGILELMMPVTKAIPEAALSVVPKMLTGDLSLKQGTMKLLQRYATTPARVVKGGLQYIEGERLDSDLNKLGGEYGFPQFLRTIFFGDREEDVAGRSELYRTGQISTGIYAAVQSIDELLNARGLEATYLSKDDLQNIKNEIIKKSKDDAFIDDIIATATKARLADDKFEEYQSDADDKLDDFIDKHEDALNWIAKNGIDLEMTGTNVPYREYKSKIHGAAKRYTNYVHQANVLSAVLKRLGYDSEITIKYDGDIAPNGDYIGALPEKDRAYNYTISIIQKKAAELMNSRDIPPDIMGQLEDILNQR